MVTNTTVVPHSTGLHGRFSNRTGTADEDKKALGIIYVLFLFDSISPFLQRATLSSDFPAVLLNQRTCWQTLQEPIRLKRYLVHPRCLVFQRLVHQVFLNQKRRQVKDSNELENEDASISDQVPVLIDQTLLNHMDPMASHDW